MPVGFTPVYRIFRGGDNITDNFQGMLTSIKVDLVSGNGSNDTCDITVDNRDGGIGFPQTGEELELYLGYKEVGLAFMGRFTVNKVTFYGPPKTIRITGQGADMSDGKIKSPLIKDFSDKTLGEIVRELGKAGGIDDVLIDEDLSKQKVPFLNMISSPMHMLHELERMYGAVSKVSQGQIVFAARDKARDLGGSEMKTQPILIMRDGHFSHYQVVFDQRNDYSGARAAYRDPKTLERKWVEHANSAPSPTGQSLNPFNIGRLFNSEGKAKAAAKAQIEALSRDGGKGQFTLSKGDPWIREGQRILVGGMEDGVNGSHVANSVVHSFTPSGLSTVIGTNRDGEGQDFTKLFDAATDAFLALEPGQLLGNLLLKPEGRIAERFVQIVP